ncbi:uncharacterized protein LTR77_002141 [Saxophila tyrrhenica]|uniref:Uncharacterized protein n=1 Tax=Saxophila tyrrhenica TaxID=1690608 RepID=A0AAV9PL79_9PEZI|nr:hypothetical protein LTR77_002141 [Saxophila tyrrhenica]
MLAIGTLLLLTANLIVTAAPHARGQTLDPRQIVTANPSVACCSSCTGAYDPTTYLNGKAQRRPPASTTDGLTVFDDFCGWANLGMELWTTMTYVTGDSYCHPGGSHCIQLAVSYECEKPYIGEVTYSGCMGYLGHAINPNACGGPLYRGARIRSADGCWIFMAVGDSPVPATSHVSLLECDGDDCRPPMRIETMAVPDEQWEDYVQVS